MAGVLQRLEPYSGLVQSEMDEFNELQYLVRHYLAENCTSVANRM